MNYFRINLNRLEDRSKLIKTYRAQALSILLILALFLAITGSYVSTYMKITAKNRVFSERVNELTEQIEELERVDNFISEDVIQDLYDLTSTRIFWTEKFELLADLSDKKIKLTSIQFVKGKLYLRGLTKVKKDSNGFSVISAFINSLKASPVFSEDFSEIRFSSSERETFITRDIIKFEVLCLRNNDQ